MNENDKELILLQMKLLYHIGNEQGFISSDGIPNKKAKEIGKMLNEIGGIEVMMGAAKQVVNLLEQKEGKTMGRELDHCWNGIGDWIA